MEAPEEDGRLPTLMGMLNTPLLEVLKSCDFAFLLRSCFREALARLVYAHSTTSQVELQEQIIRIQRNLRDEEDRAFVQLVESWALNTLQKTPKPSGAEEISVGEDPDWFANVAVAGDGLVLAGPLGTALNERIVAVISALFAVIMAHSDRNVSMALLSDDSKRSLWLTLAEPSLSSPLSVQLSTDAMQAVTAALRGERTVMQEVLSDARTKTYPFVARFPYSWFVSKTIDNARDTAHALPWSEQPTALEFVTKVSGGVSHDASRVAVKSA